MLILAGEIVFANRPPDAVEHLKRLAVGMQGLALTTCEAPRSQDRLDRMHLVHFGDRRKAQDFPLLLVGAPSYFAARSEPKRPQELIGHNCINLRLPTRGGLYAWEFEKDGRELKVHVEGQLVFNGSFQMLNAALAGFGLAYVPEDVARPHLARGRLRRVLDDWCPPYSGYHLYYPSRRQSTPAFALLVEALRYRAPRSA